MMRTNGYSQALFGGLLWGDRPVRYIFTDEAGISAHEPVTVVVGIIANADEHVLAAESLAMEALGNVPPHLRDNFIFHATEVFGHKKYQNAGWSLTDRLHLLKSMMAVPRKIGMAITIAAHWRNAIDYSDNLGKLGLSPAECDHFQAFVLCMATADSNIRNYAAPNEVATVVAEDCRDMRKFLKQVPRIFRDHPVYLPQTHLRKTRRDEEAGYCTQSGNIRISRIRNSVHFVEKDEDPLVQVADACAYGIRRYFAEEKFGNDFATAVVGDLNLLKNFGSFEFRVG